ncbi:MAG: hypothetical protein WBA34_04995 [Candidatus Deferrimicrobiaceae bacterium]
MLSESSEVPVLSAREAVRSEVPVRSESSELLVLSAREAVRQVPSCFRVSNTRFPHR